MIPEKSESDSEFPKVLAACFKETQTNNGTVIHPSSTSVFACDSVPNNTDNKEGITVFEFSHILQNSTNPHSITLVRDKFTEEVKKHSDSSVDENTGNRYQYCREVIKPYLKSFSPDCPRSEEQLIKDILDSVHEDFPDYHPCFEGQYEKKGICLKSSISKTDLIPVPAQTPEKVPKTNSRSGNTNTETTLHPKESTKGCYCLPTDMEDKRSCPPKEKPKCEKTGKSGKSGGKCPPPIKICESSPATDDPTPPITCKSPSGPSCKSAKMPADTCEDETDEDECKSNIDQKLQKKGSIRSVHNTKSSHQAINSSSPVIEKFKSVMDVHNEVIKTIRVAAEDVLDKLYVATKDAVCDYKDKPKTCQYTDTDHDLKQMSGNKSTEMITSYRLFPDSGGSEKSNDISNEKRDRLISPDDVLQQMVEKVDSTISLLRENIDFGKLASVMKTNPELNDSKRNKYDVPKTSPKELSPSGETSFFSVIKSKIYAIFHDDNNARQSDSNTSRESCEK